MMVKMPGPPPSTFASSPTISESSAMTSVATSEPVSTRAAMAALSCATWFACRMAMCFFRRSRTVPGFQPAGAPVVRLDVVSSKMATMALTTPSRCDAFSFTCAMEPLNASMTFRMFSLMTASLASKR